MDPRSRVTGVSAAANGSAHIEGERKGSSDGYFKKLPTSLFYVIFNGLNFLVLNAQTGECVFRIREKQRVWLKGDCLVYPGDYQKLCFFDLSAKRHLPTVQLPQLEIADVELRGEGNDNALFVLGNDLTLSTRIFCSQFPDTGNPKASKS